MKFAILTRPDFRSPHILAESLKLQLLQLGQSAEVFYDLSLLNRMVSPKKSKLSFHFWLKRKLKYFISDNRLIKKIKQYDAVVISDCIPNGFLKKLYNVEKFKRIIKRPVGIYEVYYLGSAPTQIKKLEENNDALSDRYDFHLSISNVTEIKQPPGENCFPIGIKSQSWNLKPLLKKEIIAIIDFAFPGNESIRKSQINALNKAGIKYISLERSYTIEEIRAMYQQGAIYFMQSYEAFGLPILECLCAGCQIFTAESWWPMSWRLNPYPQVHGDGILPECFTVYNSEEELEEKLLAFKEGYDFVKTPKRVFNNFLQNYPSFYEGNDKELQRLLKRLSNTVGERLNNN
jgi:hypothetical protein